MARTVEKLEAQNKELREYLRTLCWVYDACTGETRCDECGGGDSHLMPLKHRPGCNIAKLLEEPSDG